ncbi:hypothetical protein [Paracoccus sp. (in: a-proteobacteria)]|uniref:hypothetical protein n=1 Tax=Paracoccus sp. TaxID=267 RepID=UPI0035B4410F
MVNLFDYGPGFCRLDYGIVIQRSAHMLRISWALAMRAACCVLRAACCVLREIRQSPICFPPQ